MVDGITLLDRTLDAVAGAATVVVVGEVDAPGAIVVQEEPAVRRPSGGHRRRTGGGHAPWVLIAACDHPFVADAVGPLLDARLRG